MPSPEAIAERRVKSLELRKSGASYDAIGKALGVNKKTAYTDVKTSLKELAASNVAHSEELRAMELERLDLAMFAIAKLVREGNLQAIDRFLRLCDQRCKLLGLYAPIEVNTQISMVTSTTDYSKLEPEQLMQLYTEKLNSVPTPAIDVNPH